VNALDHAALPVVDQPFLDRLGEESGGMGSLRRMFVADFIDSLPALLDRLRSGLTTGDLAGSLAAIASLRLTSQTVGAARLGGLLLDLESELHTEAREADAVVLPRLAATFLRPIQQCSLQTTQRLQGPYLRP
jgi:hypothetical protein